MERIEKLLAFLKESPEDSFLQHALSLEYIKSGEYEKARHLFEKLLSHNPAYVGSYYHLGKLHEREGRHAEAASVYEKGIEVAQSLKDRHSLQELMQALDDLD